MSKLYQIILPLLVAVLLTACSAKETGVEKYQSQSAEEIFKGADVALKKGDDKDAIERYEAMQILYPYGDYSQQTFLNLLYVYYDDRQYDSTIAAADRYIHLYPQGPNVDYAYYIRGLAAYSRNIGFFQRYLPVNIAPRQTTAFEESFQDFNELVTRFPDSPYAADARQRMVFIRNMLAQHDLEIARYYLARKVYVAAAERAKKIVEDYPNSPQIFSALTIMLESYRALNLEKEANETLKVLNLNYPNKKVK